MINTTYKLALWADVLYACDLVWWDQYQQDVKDNFQGELWTQDPIAPSKYGLNHIPGERAPGLGKDKIHFGGNSGYQSINCAYLWGADKIVLLGYDMKREGKKSHWHGDHPNGLNNSSPYNDWVPQYGRLASDLEHEGVTVVNATRSTALECFLKMKLEDVLCGSCLPAPDLKM